MGDDFERLSTAIADHKPALVLSLGLASGATCLEVERFAVNLRYTEPGDSAKPLTPTDLSQSVIVADGMTALFATVDAERLAAAIREKAGIPARAHGYAGAYACNHILFQTLHYAQQWDLNYRAGFIHLPLSSEQAVFGKPDAPAIPAAGFYGGRRSGGFGRGSPAWRLIT